MLNSNNNLRTPQRLWCAPALLFFFICSLSSAKDYKGFNFMDDKLETSIKFRLINDLVIIPVKINDEMELNLVLDTGGRSVILFGNNFKKKLKLIKQEAILNGYGKNRGKTASISLDNKVQLGDALGKGISILITNGRYFFPYDGETKIHGIIGYQIFSRFVVTIDYKNEKLTLTEPDFYRAPSDYRAMDLTLKDTKPYIKMDYQITEDVKSNGFFHIDTGSSREVLMFIQEGEDKLSDVNVKRCSVGKGLNGYISGYKGFRSNVLFEDMEADSRYFVVKREFSSRELRHAEGSIGSAFLKNFTIVIDYVNEKFYYRERDS